MMIAPLELTKPAAGVITTNPATTPEQKPRMLGLPLLTNSATAHVVEATAAARVVVMNALAAIPSAATALPALNPYQPTQSIPVPTMHRTMLWGAMISFPNPSRLPTIKHRMSADHPEDMCTTVPPAKSMALIFAFAFHTPFIKPSTPQTMWASGKYTINIHKTTNTMIAMNFMRSAIAPTISAGVIIANIIWYMENTLWLTQ